MPAGDAEDQALVREAQAGPPDFVAALRDLINRADFRSIVEFE